ncbi:hypothetical protein JCM11641_001232 [Rhodosporidiobolus odoratus]
MSSYGTPSSSRTSKRATQPPLGPSLSTPHRSPYPSSLRPSLFHPRPSPSASAALSPATATATASHTLYATPYAVTAAGRLVAPQNTPSSAYAPRTSSSLSTSSTTLPISLGTSNSATYKNPYEALPATAFDSFVSSLTSSIRSALAPVDSETPSQRRKREREDRLKEREEAQRLREEAQREREERAAALEQERQKEVERERENREEDVFGEILAVGDRDEARENGGPYLGTRENTAEVFEEDFATPHQQEARPPSRSSTRYSPLPDNVSLRSSPAPQSAHIPSSPATIAAHTSYTYTQETDVLLSSSPAASLRTASPNKKPLFVPRGPGSATDEDELASADSSARYEEAEIRSDADLSVEMPDTEGMGRSREGTVDAYETADEGGNAEDGDEEGEHAWEKQTAQHAEVMEQLFETNGALVQAEVEEEDYYATPDEREVRYSFAEDEDGEDAERAQVRQPDGEEEGSHEAGGQEVRGVPMEEEGGEWSASQSGLEGEDEAEAAETIDLLDDSTEEEGDAEGGESPCTSTYGDEEEDEDLPDPASAFPLSSPSKPSLTRPQATGADGSSRSPSPSAIRSNLAPEAEGEREGDQTDLSDAQLEAQLSLEANRHKALPEDTHDASDRLVESFQGTYPSWAVDEGEAESSRSPSPARQEEEEEEAEEEKLEAMVEEAHRHNRLPADTPDVPDRMVDVVEGRYSPSPSPSALERSPSPTLEDLIGRSGKQQQEATEEQEQERDLVAEAHRHNALPRDTPDAPDKMVEELQGSEWPLSEGEEGKEEDQEMVDVEYEQGERQLAMPEGEGDADSAALGDVETDGDGPVAAAVDQRDGGEAEEVEEGEFFGEGVPGDEVEMGREEDAGEGEERLEGAGPEEVGAGEIPLEALYADEDSEDLQPRFSAQEKGKGKAPPTPSNQSASDVDENDDDVASLGSADVDILLTEWDASRLETYEDSELIETIQQLRFQLGRAVEGSSPIARYIATMLIDTEALFRRRRDLDSDVELVFEDEYDSDVGEKAEWPREEDFDSGGEGAEEEDGEVIMPSEMQDEEEGVDANSAPDRSAFDEGEPEEDGPSSLESLTPDQLAQLSRAETSLSFMVDHMVSEHERTNPDVPTSELFIPTSALSSNPAPAPPALDSHFQREIGPEPAFDSRVNFPVAPIQTSVDAPLESQERNQEETVQEMIEEKDREVAPLGEAQDVLHGVRAGEQADLPTGVGEAGGMQVVDDDEPFSTGEVTSATASEPRVSAPSPSGPMREPVDPVSLAAVEPSTPLQPDAAADAPLSPAGPVDVPTSSPRPAAESAYSAYQAISAPPRDPFPPPQPDPIVPIHALTEPTFSSHFCREIGPEPAFDSRVQLDLPPTVTREGDALDWDEERAREVKRMTRLEEAGREEGEVLPLSQAVDASKSEQREADDFQQPRAEKSGLTIVDDDDELPATADSAPTVEAVLSPPPHEKSVLGATPPPPDLPVSVDDPPIVDGVAPPQNIALVAEPLPATPAVQAPSPPSFPSASSTQIDQLASSAITVNIAPAEPSLQPRPPSPAIPSATQDEIRFDDFMKLDDSIEDEGEGDEAGDEDQLVSEDERSSPRPSGGTSKGVLGLPAGEDVETSDAAPIELDESEDEDSEEEEEEGEGTKNGEVEELVIASSEDDDESVVEEEKSRVEQAPSSEPIDYRSEDERAMEDRELVEEPDEELQTVSDVQVARSPLHVHDVAEPGEWSPDMPLRFGTVPSAIAENGHGNGVEEGELVEDETEQLGSSSPAVFSPLPTAEPVDAEDAAVEPEIAEGVQPEAERAADAASLGDTQDGAGAGAGAAEQGESLLAEESEVRIEMDADGGDGEVVLPSDIQSVRSASVTTELASTASDVAFEVLGSVSTAPSARSASPTATHGAVDETPADTEQAPPRSAEQSAQDVPSATTGMGSDATTSADEASADPHSVAPGATEKAASQPEVEPHQPSPISQQPVTSVDFASTPAEVQEEGEIQEGTPQESQPSETSSRSSLLVPSSDGAIKPFGSLASAASPSRAEPEPAQLVEKLQASTSDGEVSEDEVVFASVPPSRPPSRTAKKTAASRSIGDEVSSETPRRRSSRLPAPDQTERPATPASVRRTRSTTKEAELAPPSPLPKLAEPEPASPVRRSSRLSVPVPSSAPPSKPKRGRRSNGEETDDQASAASPAKRPRRVGPSKLRAGSVEEDVHLDLPRTSVSPDPEPQPFREHHHHHHHNNPPVGQESQEGPVTRSKCAFQRLKIRSKQNPESEPYLFNVPACALTSSLSRELMRSFPVENLGPIDHHDACHGIPLGGSHGAGASSRLHERHSALVPDMDVEEVVRRIVGTELWDEGVCEVVPRTSEEEEGEGGGGEERTRGESARGRKRSVEREEVADSGQGKKRRK